MMILKTILLVLFISFHENGSGTHWWSFLDLHQRREIFLFNSFGFGDFKKFVIDNDRNVLNKVMYGIKKFQKKTKKSL